MASSRSAVRRTSGPVRRGDLCEALDKRPPSTRPQELVRVPDQPGQVRPARENAHDGVRVEEERDLTPATTLSAAQYRRVRCRAGHPAMVRASGGASPPRTHG